MNEQRRDGRVWFTIKSEPVTGLERALLHIHGQHAHADRPTALEILEQDRYELRDLMGRVARELALPDRILFAQNANDVNAGLYEDDFDAVVIMHGEELPLRLQAAIAKGQVHLPQLLFVLTEVGPTKLCERRIWSKEFCDVFRRRTYAWPTVDRRKRDWPALFALGVDQAVDALRREMENRTSGMVVTKMGITAAAKDAVQNCQWKAADGVAGILELARKCVDLAVAGQHAALTGEHVLTALATPAHQTRRQVKMALGESAG